MSDSVLGWVVRNGRVYDLLQTVAGYQLLARIIRPLLDEARGGTVLDAGAGTGALADLLPSETTYVALDLDPRKLARLRKRLPDAMVHHASVTRIPLSDDAVNIAAMVNV